MPTVADTVATTSLDDYNLNGFSLFDTEETLLETMWFREHVLKNFD
jgi:hypothetical protein